MINPEKNFQLKITNYGTMEKEDTKFNTSSKLELIIDYIHPSLKENSKKKVPIKSEMDIYSLFVTIARLEYGEEIFKYDDQQIDEDYHKNHPSKDIKYYEYCQNNYTENCHDNFLIFIYLKFGVLAPSMQDFRLWQGEAYFKEIKVSNFVQVHKFCDCLFCIILRELRMVVSDVDNSKIALNYFEEMVERQIDRQNIDNVVFII